MVIRYSTKKGYIFLCLWIYYTLSITISNEYKYHNTIFLPYTTLRSIVTMFLNYYLKYQIIFAETRAKCGVSCYPIYSNITKITRKTENNNLTWQYELFNCRFHSENAIVLYHSSIVFVFAFKIETITCMERYKCGSFYWCGLCFLFDFAISL